VIRRIVAGIDRGLNAVVTVLVVTILVTMVLLSFVQVVSRNVTGGGFFWADVVLRHMVLMIGMLGAVLAARHGRQISIDVLSRFVPAKIRVGLNWLIGIFTITITIMLTRASLVFLAAEREFHSELAAGLPAWPFQLVIPVGFTLIGLQVLLNLLLGVKKEEEVIVVEAGEEQA